MLDCTASVRFSYILCELGSLPLEVFVSASQCGYCKNTDQNAMEMGYAH